MYFNSYLCCTSLILNKVERSQNSISCISWKCIEGRWENVTVMYSIGLVLPLFVTHELWQNPINLTQHRTAWVQGYRIFWIIRQYLYWPKFLQVIFGYCPYTWALQLMRGVFHLDISFICWFSDFRILFYVFLNLHSYRNWCRRQGGQEMPWQLMYRCSWRVFWTCLWDRTVSFD
jgi:hypothetical protein